MMHLLFGTQNEWVGLILRVFLGGIMFPHGAQKLFGWFGGYGLTATIDFFTKSIKLPWALAIAVILIESLGAVSLMFGFASKIWALGLLLVMIGAIITTNLKNGFFMNWFGNQSGEGYEYHLLVIGICIAIMITGSGKISIDSLLHK